MNVRTDIIQLDCAIQAGALRGFDDQNSMLSWMTAAIKQLADAVEYPGQTAVGKYHSIVLTVTMTENELVEVDIAIDPSYNRLTCPVVEPLEDFSLV